MPRIDKKERDLHAEFLAKLDEVRANMEELIEESKRIREESVCIVEQSQQHTPPNPSRTDPKKK